MTFDEGGVSGHPNHVALSLAAQELARERASPHTCGMKLWVLETTNIGRKYMGILDLFLSWVFSLWDGGLWLIVNWNPLAAYRAMAAHASQFVWYRRLFVIFSRYAYVNTLREIT